MKILIQSTDEKITLQLAHFCANYSVYADLLKVDPDKITLLTKGSVYMTFVMGMQNKVQASSITFTSYKDLARGGNGTDILGALPVLPKYPDTVPPVCNANVEALLRDVTQQCVKSGKLSDDIAKALGIFYDPILQNLEEGTPDLSLKSMSAGHPTLHATLKDYEGFEIWKDAGIGFVFLNVSTSANFTDTAALPAVGVEVIWKYKVIYRYKNAQIGNWSATISVAVKGSV